jgi:voltage-gated potassium channel
VTNQARSRPDSTDGSPGQDVAIEAQAGSAPLTDLGRLPRRERRRLVVIALIRTAASVTVLMLIYFNIPLESVTEGAAGLLLTAGLVGVAVVLAVQIRATMKSVYPGLRAVESLGVSVPLILLLFSVTHYLLERSTPNSYTEPLTRLDALYFSVTMFATVGFGDITPVTELARVITVLQMLANLIFLGIVARVLFGAAIDNRPSPVGPSPGR